MPTLLAGVTILAAVPHILAIVLTALAPWFGQVYEGTSGWHLLHVIWIYPTLLIAAAVIERKAKKTLRLRQDSVPFWIVTTVFFGAAISAIYKAIFFADWLGAIVAAVMTCALWKPTVWLLERGAAKENEAGD